MTVNATKNWSAVLVIRSPSLSKALKHLNTMQEYIMVKIRTTSTSTALHVIACLDYDEALLESGIAGDCPAG
jgi:hypothetical protein